MLVLSRKKFKQYLVAKLGESQAARQTRLDNLEALVQTAEFLNAMDRAECLRLLKEALARGQFEEVAIVMQKRGELFNYKFGNTFLWAHEAAEKLRAMGRKNPRFVEDTKFVTQIIEFCDKAEWSFSNFKTESTKTLALANELYKKRDGNTEGVLAKLVAAVKVHTDREMFPHNNGKLDLSRFDIVPLPVM